MAKTRNELVTDAIDLLGRGPGPGQPVPPEDYAIVDGYISPLFNQLAADGVVTVPDHNAIEDAYYIPLSMLLANACGFKFGIPFDNERKEALERQIRRIVAPSPTYEPVRAQYF